MFSHNKDRKNIEQNFHSVARVMPRGGTCGCGGVKNFSVGICDGAPLTARSSFYLLLSPNLCFISFLYLDLYVLGDNTLIS